MKIKYFLFLLLVPVFLQAQNRPFRVGTTTAGFLEIGFGSAGAAMGDAYVSMARDISSIYWNPAGLAFMEQSEAQFVLQPWVVDINTSFAAAGIVIPQIGTVALGLTFVDYGEMDVNTVSDPEGTGERFSAGDFSLSLAYGRAITNWFGFGLAAKYIQSKIWHMDASALALDLGVSINTAFFSPTGNREDGMRIAMSIANYGTRMKFDGIDLLQSIDIRPDENGNYGDVQGQFDPNEWELPLIFRLGIAVNVFRTENQRLTIATDALHPNNNAESVNVGGEYEYFDPTIGKFILRTGYKGFFLAKDEAAFGFTVGGGLEKLLMGNISLKVDYAFRDMGILGKVHSYSIGFLF
jgi:opacity protein-like surface antigen